uniref:Bm12046 n=1 Tax=Brugia malayi TaxID=6279 RepID=A0A1I9G844_BRUMA|nr:Bm12046 [Brugia malayi]
MARRRTAEMSSLFRSYSRYNKERIGEKHRVLVCELATDQQHYVRITDVSKFYMKAVLIGGDINAWLSNDSMAIISVLAHSYRITAFSIIMSILIFWLLLL